MCFQQMKSDSRWPDGWMDGWGLKGGGWQPIHNGDPRLLQTMGRWHQLFPPFFLPFPLWRGVSYWMDPGDGEQLWRLELSPFGLFLLLDLQEGSEPTGVRPTKASPALLCVSRGNTERMGGGRCPHPCDGLGAGGGGTG